MSEVDGVEGGVPLRARLPKGVKPVKVLAKRKPTNSVDADYSSGALHVREDGGFELHVTDGSRAAVIEMDVDYAAVGGVDEFCSGELTAPAIRELMRGGTLERAAGEVVVAVEADDAETTFPRDERLVESVMDVSHLIPELRESFAVSIDLNVKRLVELATAMGTEKVSLILDDPEAEVIRVEPFEGRHYGSIKQLRRQKVELEPEGQDETLEPDGEQ